MARPGSTGMPSKVTSSLMNLLKLLKTGELVDEIEDVISHLCLLRMIPVIACASFIA